VKRLRRIASAAWYHCAVLTCHFLAKGIGDGSGSLGCVFDAIDQVVRILALETVIERKRLQAREADQVGVLERF